MSDKRIVLTPAEKKMIISFRRENRASWNELIAEARDKIDDDMRIGLARKIRADVVEMRKLRDAGAAFFNYESDFGWYE